MENPWGELPAEALFVLESDRAPIVAFNASAPQDAFVHLELLPEPFVGRPGAPVVLLNLNPGFSAKDSESHSNSTFAAVLRENLLHAELDYPFYLLNPELPGLGYWWWERKLRRLIRDCGQETVARNLLCVEYFPYHSRRYQHHKLRVPSQEYSFSLVRAAIARGSLVVLMRAKRQWLGAVPELESYPQLLELKNPQNPTVSPGNCPDGYSRIVHVIKTGQVPGHEANAKSQCFPVSN